MGVFPYKRIVVIGATGSGKSTLAMRIANKLRLDFIELDALHWEPDWKEAETDMFLARVEAAIQSPGWVVAGNYSKARHLIWTKAEVVIWLDYPLPIVFWRLLARTIRRSVCQEELWNGNRETLGRFLRFWSRDSLIYWLFKTYWARKREFPVLLSPPGYERLKVFHFKSPRELERWLKSMAQ
ncbi:MAG: adenylate kinase [Chloroflexi bacterium]|nr:hypothetical protein [Anaerolineales bacterium]RIK55050.1 MAG: adenylate kinase [Chloroflexota bacterium]